MLVFSHIPKTAGTTFNAILRKNFGSSLISVFPEDGDVYQKSDFESDFKQDRHPAGISSHALKPFTDFNELESKFEWVTFLRDPVERYVSQYIHQQTGNSEHFKMDIFSWARNYGRSNWQVKWLAGEENLEKAIEVAEKKITFIGVVEHFDESLVLMNQCLREPLDISYDAPLMVVRDRSLKNELLNDEETRAFIVEQNELDIKFYNYVLDNIFYKQGHIGKETPPPMSFLRKKSRLYGFFYKNYLYRMKKQSTKRTPSPVLEAKTESHAQTREAA